MARAKFKSARFPLNRIKRIMQVNEEVGKLATAVPVLVSRAVELFIEQLVQGAMQAVPNAKLITSSHVRHCIDSQEQFDFLRDLVQNVPVELQKDTAEAVESPASDLAEKKPRERRKRKSTVVTTRKAVGGESVQVDVEGSMEQSDVEEALSKKRRPQLPALTTLKAAPEFVNPMDSLDSLQSPAIIFSSNSGQKQPQSKSLSLSKLLSDNEDDFKTPKINVALRNSAFEEEDDYDEF